MHAPGLALLLAGCFLFEPAAGREQHPLSPEDRERIEQRSRAAVAELTARIAEQPDEIDLYSRRGDAYFFLGDFKRAVADYERMVKLDPDLDTSHWRRGIAYFYAGQHKQAARQFEVYHTFDNIDRENGIWRFLSQVKADGAETARAGLLKYEKDDREPFPAVYRLFAGQTTPDEILRSIREADIPPGEREKRLFYAQLYIGLNHAVADKPDDALRHLREAVANSWGAKPESGYGPHYMWHVGRVHYELLVESRTAP